MGWAGPLLAGLGTGFAQAARQRQLQKWDTEQQQYHDTLNFYENIAKDPRLNPAYLPQVVSGIAQLHGLKPGKKDHDQLVQTVKGLSSLLQGGEGAPTEDVQSQGLVQNPNPTGPPPTQPTHGAMVGMPHSGFGQMPNQMQLPPMPQIAGVSVPGAIQNFSGGGQDAQQRPRLVANQSQFQPQPQQEDQGQLNPIALPPAPQLLTQGQITSKKTLPAFVNPNMAKYDAQTEMWLKRIAAQGDNAQTLAGIKHEFKLNEMDSAASDALTKVNLQGDLKNKQRFMSQFILEKNDPLNTGKSDEEIKGIAAQRVKEIDDSVKAERTAKAANLSKNSAAIDERLAQARRRLDQTDQRIGLAQHRSDMSDRWNGIRMASNQLHTRLGNFNRDLGNINKQLELLKPDDEQFEQKHSYLIGQHDQIKEHIKDLEDEIQAADEGSYGANVGARTQQGGKPKLQPKGGGGGVQLSPEQQEQFNRLKQKRPDLTIEQYLNAIKQ